MPYSLPDVTDSLDYCHARVIGTQAAQPGWFAAFKMGEDMVYDPIVVWVTYESHYELKSNRHKESVISVQAYVCGFITAVLEDGGMLESAESRGNFAGYVFRPR